MRWRRRRSDRGGEATTTVTGGERERCGNGGGRRERERRGNGGRRREGEARRWGAETLAKRLEKDREWDAT
ncbi:hypothetical protein U1Q18_015270 [Sarracenia purpurea var. burkii]